MEIPVLKTIDIVGEAEIADDFVVGAVAYIGEENSEGVDFFYFKLITPKRLARMIEEKDIVNCRGMIVVKDLNLSIVEKEVNKILKECIRPTWDEAAQAINRYLEWEYDNIQYTSVEEAQKQLYEMEQEENH